MSQICLTVIPLPSGSFSYKIKKIAYKTSSSKEGSSFWAGRGFSPVTGMVVEIPVAIGTREDVLGFFWSPMDGGVEPAEAFSVEGGTAWWAPFNDKSEFIKESGEILREVGLKSSSLNLLSFNSSSSSSSLESSSMAMCAELLATRPPERFKVRGLNAGEVGVDATGKSRGLASAKAIFNSLDIVLRIIVDIKDVQQVSSI